MRSFFEDAKLTLRDDWNDPRFRVLLSVCVVGLLIVLLVAVLP